jgi:DNA-binding transcriptional ArsR family regulator
MKRTTVKPSASSKPPAPGKPSAPNKPSASAKPPASNKPPSTAKPAAAGRPATATKPPASPPLAALPKPDALQRLLGRVRSAVLAELLTDGAGTLYVREVSRRTGLALAAVQRELALLADLGIIRAERRGRQVYYSPDESSPLTLPLRTLIDTKRLRTSLLAGVLSGVAGEIRVALTYGPDLPDASLGVLVIGAIGFEQAYAALAPLATRLKVELRLLVFSEAGFRERASDPAILALLRGELRYLVGDAATLKQLLGV